MNSVKIYKITRRPEDLFFLIFLKIEQKSQSWWVFLGSVGLRQTTIF